MNAAVDVSSVTAQSALLLGPEGNPIPATVSLTGTRTIAFAPNYALPGNTKFTEELTTQLTDLNGRALPSNSFTSFTTAEQTWSGPNAYSYTLDPTPGGLGISPFAVADSVGDLTVVSETYQSPSGGVANRYDAASGQWVASQIEGGGMGPGYYGIAAAPNGDAYVCQSYIPNNSPNGVMYCDLYVKARQVWTYLGAPPAVPAGVATGPVQAVVDGAGAVTLVTLGNLVAPLYATRSTNSGVSWTAPVQISGTIGNATPYIEQPKAVVDSAGHVIAGWIQVSPNGFVLEAAQFNPATGTWSSPIQINEVNPTISVTQFSLATNPSGQAVFAWSENAGLDSNVSSFIEASTYDPTTGSWATPVVIDDGTSSALGANQVAAAIDAAGNATVLYSHPTDSYWYARFASSSKTWTGAAAVAQKSMLRAPLQTQPAITADLAGNVVAVMIGSNNVGTRQQVSAVFSSSSNAWGAPTVIDSAWATAGYTGDPISVVDGNGIVSAFWYGPPDPNRNDPSILTDVFLNRFQ
jgi:hypothetical protein